MKGLTSYHSQPMKSSVNPGWRHAFISLMIVAYFIIATAQMVPEGAAYDFAFSEVEPVVLLFGLKQRWNLFAPDIRHMNQYSTCVVTMKDGTDRLYEWPRDRQSNFLEGFSRMRYRHFETNCWEAPKYAKLRQFGARFMARS